MISSIDCKVGNIDLFDMHIMCEMYHPFMQAYSIQHTMNILDISITLGFGLLTMMPPLTLVVIPVIQTLITYTLAKLKNYVASMWPN